MRNNIGTVPFNPFIGPDDDLATFERFGVHSILPGDVPLTAAGFDELADTGKWGDPVLQALRDAAATIRFSADLARLPEPVVVQNRLNDLGGLSLVLRS